MWDLKEANSQKQKTEWRLPGAEGWVKRKVLVKGYKVTAIR